MDKSILLCGVGGQGTVLASKLIAAAFMQAGEVVHSAETIGMAQRGGSVTSHVRIGESAFSPLIPSKTADLILAFEPAEAVRNLPLLKENGTVIANSVPVKPVNDMSYNGAESVDYLKNKVKNAIIVDAEELCREFGSSKFFNIAILGVACGAKKLGVSREQILGEIEKRVPKKFLEQNIAAFQKGERIGESYAAE